MRILRGIAAFVFVFGAAVCALPLQAATNHVIIRHIKAGPLPTPHYPTVALHTEFMVEVNHMGQVVRVKSGKESPNPTFNAQTYGNVLQMFIRRPDGSAQTGMYRITYDYNPKTRSVRRGIALVSEGGEWANDEGAVTDMLKIDARNRRKHLGLPLPGLESVIKPTPTHKPH